MDTTFEKKIISRLRSVLRKSVRSLKLLEIKIVFFFFGMFETENKRITTVVFSKDRAMQLHAFLISFLQKTKNFNDLVVLYKASTHDHQKSYSDLKDIFKGSGRIVFLEEENFRSQLLTIIRNVSSSSLMFSCDDMIFINEIDYTDLSSLDKRKYQISLTRGTDFTISQVLDRKLNLPHFSFHSNNFMAFQWNESEEFSDWTYPIGVGAYIFDTREIRFLLRKIEFKAPNSLEGNLQVFVPIYNKRLGICPKLTSAVYVHANLVQEEVQNRVLGSFSIEELLQKWLEGYQIKVQEFYGKSADEAQFMHYSFEKRS